MLADLAERVANVVPRYGAAVWAILSRPVSETLPRAGDPRLTTDALVFWAISVIFYLVVKLLIYDVGVDETRYFVSRMLGELIALIALTLAFALATRIFRASVPVHAVLAAVALFTAAVFPVTTVVMGANAVIWLAMSPDLFHEFGRFLFSCTTGESFVGAMSGVRDGMAAGGLLAIGLTFIQAVFVACMITVWVVYGVAFFRVIGRLAGARGARLAGIAVSGLLLGFLALLFVQAFDWAIGQGMGGC